MSGPLFIINFGTTAKQEFRVKPKKLPAPPSERSTQLQSQQINNTIQLDMARHSRKKDAQLEKYIKIIDRRYGESEINGQYVFPRQQAEEYSTSSSIDSMNGTLVYKLSRQNRKLRHQPAQPIEKKPPSRMLIREKVQWPYRRRLMTQSSRSKERVETRNSSNPIHNDMPDSARLGNPLPRKPQTGRKTRSRSSRLVQSVILNLQCSSVLRP